MQEEKIAVSAKKIIAVGSGKGGVGKSTVSVNLAVALAKTGAKVGLLDADIYGPNIPMMLGTKERPMQEDDKIVPVEVHGLKIVSVAMLVNDDDALMWRGPLLHKIVRQFLGDVVWGDLDYLIIDLPPGTGDVQLSLCQSVDLTGGILVTTPQPVAVGEARRGASSFSKFNVPIIGIIENMSGDIFGEGGGEVAATELGVDFLGRIPLNKDVRIDGDAGVPFVSEHPDTAEAKIYTEITAKIAK